VVDDAWILDLAVAAPGLAPSLRALLEGGADALASARDAVRGQTPTYELAEVEFQPVIPDPHAIWCAALNYQAHADEGKWPKQDYPGMFLRVADSQCGHEQPLVRPRISERFDYEGELAAIIGQPCRDVPAGEALGVVAGYACYNEGSVRDWQRHTAQITPGKNFWSTGAFGPWMVTADDFGDPRDHVLTTRLNGQVVQHSSIADMLFDLPYLISYLSTICHLLPGDVIVTGTPGGVGARQTPPRFLRHGDSVEVEIDGIGVLRNPVVDQDRVDGHRTPERPVEVGA
jgi:2-keto-4-pentenoate hydratase/2-oxohepta-3-ene-1,7-dioic acid hydratase in catechol pathway